MALWKNVRNSFSKVVPVVKKILHPAPKNVRGFEVPISFGSSARTAGSAVKNVYQSLKTFATKKTINPSAGVSGASNIAKALGKSVGIGALAGTIFGVGREISKAGITGELPNVRKASSAVARTAVTGAGIGFSPIGGALGVFEGTGIASARTAKERIQEIFGIGQSKLQDATNVFKDVNKTMPTFPSTVPDVNINNFYPSGGTLMDNVPQMPQTIFVESPQVPNAGFSPSFIVGGGGGLSDNLPLLLLLGAGIGGFALGRKRKKKKKKYKKRRR